MQFSNLYSNCVSDFANPKQVLFINQSHSKILDDFFHRNLNKVNAFFSRCQKEFIFLPDLLTAEYAEALLRYNFPDYPEQLLSNAIREINMDKIYDLFMNFQEWRRRHPDTLVMDDDESPFRFSLPAPHTGLVYTVSKDRIVPLTEYQSPFTTRCHTCGYNFATLEEGDDDSIWAQLEEWEDHFFSSVSRVLCHKGGISYSHKGEAEELTSDDNFLTEAYQLSEEIKERVEKLRRMGVNELIIKGLFNFTPKISRLYIREDYRIFLLDYGNREIVMSPLPKAVFLLFLKHPEGILFKQICEWSDELLSLYCRCSGREADMEMQQSINAIVNPLNNSLNEKCSRIREAFLRELNDNLAQHYYITGVRGKPKTIRIDRKMVVWEKREQSR